MTTDKKKPGGDKLDDRARPRLVTIANIRRLSTYEIREAIERSGGTFEQRKMKVGKPVLEKYFDREFLATSYLAAAMEVYRAISGVTGGVSGDADEFVALSHAYLADFGEWLTSLDKREVEFIIALVAEKEEAGLNATAAE